jgi:tRNA pseudouridine38-40 synthase
MQRYFIQMAYNGSAYNGVAKQLNTHALTVQALLDTALTTLFKIPLATTTSSRTDAGVHAASTYVHFDSPIILTQKHVYNLNALLPPDVSIQRLIAVPTHYHSRFDALARQYCYTIVLSKQALHQSVAWYYPFGIDATKLAITAQLILHHTHFYSMSKKHSDNFTDECTITQSHWDINIQQQHLQYHITGNRFLRGMVRALVATQMQVARGVITLKQFEQILQQPDNKHANFNAPAQGLTLIDVHYPEAYFNNCTVLTQRQNL